jgi:large subunit ribosomal protein L11
MDIKLELDVIGGKATTGKPIGPKVIPLGLDVNEVVNQINKKTSNYEGLGVKVELILNPETREFKISLPKPKVTDLIKEHSKNNQISKNDLIKIANLLVSKPADLYTKITELEGTCKSMHIKII